MNEPSKENLCAGYNPYYHETGFLSDKNFKKSEQRAIKSVSHKITLCELEKDNKEGGSEPLTYNKNIQTLMNYDQTYYQMVTDKVFPLSLKELRMYVYDRGWEFRAKPTEKSLLQSAYEIYRKRGDGLWDYWITDPAGDFPSNVRCVLGDLDIVHTMAYTVDGVRPALYLDRSKVKSDVGSGSLTDPYLLEGKGF